MIADTEEADGERLAMKKRQIQLADGRYMIFYTFDATSEGERPSAEQPQAEFPQQSPQGQDV